MSACCPENLDDGASPGGVADTSAYAPAITFQTTNATPVVVDVVDLPVAGAWSAYEVTVVGYQTNGDGQFYFKLWAAAARNAEGIGINQQGNIGPNGSTDVGTPPWTAPGAVPAGWGGVTNTTAITATGAGIEITGAVATTINWAVSVTRTLGGGAIAPP